jgi:putative ABC transport system permease protein
MKLRDFRIGWRLLVKEPGYSAVVILGLSIGFAVCFLLLGYVRYCLSYDSAVPQAQQIYLIENRFNLIGKPAWYELSPIPFLQVALKSGMVEAGTPVRTIELELPSPSVQHANYLVMYMCWARRYR